MRGKYDINTDYSVDRIKVNDSMVALAKSSFGDTVDVDFSSLLGYNIDVMTNIVSNMAIRDNLREDERFIVSARKTESLDKISDSIGYKDKLATSSIIVAKVKMTIPVGYEIAENDSGIPTLTLPYDTVISYLGNEFTLPGDIEISKYTDTNGDVIFNAFLINNLNNDDMSVGSLPTNTVDIGTNGIEVSFVTNLSQIVRRSIDYTVPSRNPSVFHKISLPANNQLQSIQVFGTFQIGAEYVEKEFIQLDNIFQEYNGPSSEYTFIQRDEGDRLYEIWLDNGTVSAYVETGTSLRIVIKETNGSIGTFNSPALKVKTPTELLPIELSITSNYSSIDGTNQFTFAEKKLDMIRYTKHPDGASIINYDDYSYEFNKLMSNTRFNIDFFLRRQDPDLTQTDVFISINDTNDGSYLFTNTVAPSFVNTDFTNSKIITPCMIYTLLPDGSFSTDSISPTGYSLINLAGNGTKKIMFSPFLYKGYNILDTISVGTFLPNYNKTYVTLENIYTRREEISTNLFPLTLEHTGVLHDLSIGVQTNFNINMFATNNGSTVDISDMEVYLVYESETTESQYVYYKKLTIDSTDFSSDVDIRTSLLDGVDDYIDIIDEDTSAADWGIDTTYGVGLPLNGKLKILTFNSYSGTEELNVPYYLEGIVGANKALLNSYQTIDLFEFYTDFTRVLKVLTYTEDEVNYKLLHIPLLGLYDYIDKTSSTSLTMETGESILREIYNMYTTIKDNIIAVEVEPNVSTFKLANTYGYTDQFTEITEPDFNISFELTFKFIDKSVTLLKEEIKLNIINTVNNVINDDTVTNLYLSTITTNIENSFPQVLQVRVSSLSSNIYEEETKKDISKMSKEELRNYIPAIMNLKIDNIYIETN